MPAVIWLIVAIVIISAVVGAIAQFLNKLNEAAAPPPRRPVPRREPAAARGDAEKDMDRFLAEIDRLRRKNAEGGDQPPAPRSQPQRSQRPATATPVSRTTSGRQSERQSDRPRRMKAELAEAPAPTPRSRRSLEAPLTTPETPSQTQRTEDLPVATVVTPTSSTGAPATRVTRLPTRARPTPKTNLAMNLTNLLGSNQGIAMAVILQEILGPPKCKPRG